MARHRLDCISSVIIFRAGTNFGALLAHPFYALSFVAAYLGMPFTVIGPRLGVSVGLFELAVYLAFILLAAKRGLLNARSSVVFLAFIFCAFSLRRSRRWEE